MNIQTEALYGLVAKLNVMKPFSVKNTNIKQQDKLLSLLNSNEYIAEDKIDGCHYMMIACRFFSTEHVEKTDNYPHLRDFFIKLNMPNIILDGEINYPGKTSQYCTRVTGSDASTAIHFQNTNGPICYTIWDILRTPKGTWLVNEPLQKRRKILEYWYDEFVRGTLLEPYIKLTQWVDSNKKAFKDEVISSGGEGIILKKKNSLYIMGKKPAWMWIKIKVHDTADLFISGYDKPECIYKGENYEGWAYWRDVEGKTVPVTKYYYMGWIGALELSAYVNGKVHKVCSCSGLKEDIRKQISDNPEAYLNKVVKISYMESTEAGYPRHPSFEEFHESKTATECEWTFNE